MCFSVCLPGFLRYGNLRAQVLTFFKNGMGHFHRRVCNSGNVRGDCGKIIVSEKDRLAPAAVSWNGKEFYLIFKGAIPPRHEQDLRSEEHTSELQSREKLVCRLLLE